MSQIIKRQPVQPGAATGRMRTVRERMRWNGKTAQRRREEIYLSLPRFH